MRRIYLESPYQDLSNNVSFGSTRLQQHFHFFTFDVLMTSYSGFMKLFKRKSVYLLQGYITAQFVHLIAVIPKLKKKTEKKDI